MNSPQIAGPDEPAGRQHVPVEAVPPPGPRRGPAFWTPLFVAAAAMLVYVLTGAPGPYWGDGMELTAAASVLGVAHPTGYPLYTCLGHLVLRALAWMEPARAMTLMSSVFCAVAAALAARVFLARASGGERPRAAHAVAAAGFAALFALARTVWDHATFAEVYPLTLALGMGVLAMAAAPPPTEPRAALRRVLGMAVLWGTAALNHYSIILLAPLSVLTLLEWARAVEPGRPWRRFLGYLLLHTFTAACFLLGYLYMPLRARAAPLANWGDPRDLRHLWWMLSGGEYLTRHTPGGPSALKSALEGLMLWPGYYGEQFADLADAPARKAMEALLGAPILLGGIAGIWSSRRARPLHAAGLLGVFAMSLLICVGYRIPDLDGYLMLGIAVALMGWIELARAQWRRLGPGARDRFGRLAPAVPLFGAAAVFFSLLPAVNKSWDDGPSRWADAVFNNLPQNAMLLTRQGKDSEVFALMYEQIAKGRRRDVLVYGTGFVFQSWYARQVGTMHPDADLVELDREPSTKAQFDQALFGGVIVPNYRRGRLFTTIFNDETVSKYLNPKPAAELLPKAYYHATAYRIDLPSPFLYELRVDPNDVPMFVDAFKERFRQDPPDPANRR